MRSPLTLFFLVLAGPLFGQHQPVPDYIARQNFPDSVLNVPLVSPDGTEETFANLLQSFRGRRVMIDIWASWCPDCIEGLPKVEALRRETDSRKVAFVFLSVDENDKKWRQGIKRFFATEATHYRIPAGWKNALSNYIVLDWIPRYLTLDENGRIIMPKAIVVDDRALLESVERFGR